MKSLLKKSVIFFAVLMFHDTQFFCGSGVSNLHNRNHDDVDTTEIDSDSSEQAPLPALLYACVKNNQKLKLQQLPADIRCQITDFAGLNDLQADRLPLQSVLRRKKSSLQAVATLLVCGADCSIVGKKDKKLPLSLAICSYRDVDCMNYKKINRYNIIFSYLLCYGARPEQLNMYNRSCVHTAVIKCNTFALSQILAKSKSSACFKQKDHCNRDPLGIAQANLRDNDIDICHNQKRACIAVSKKTTLHMVQTAVKAEGKTKKVVAVVK